MCAWRSFWAHWGTPWPARIVFIIKMYFIFPVLLPFHVVLLSEPSQIRWNPRGILGIPSLGFRLLISREPPDFNRHVRRCSSGPRRRRNPARYGKSAFGSRYVNDPVAQQKLLRFGKNTVCDRHAIFFAAHNFRFIRFGQALCGHKLSRSSQVVRD